MRIGGGSMTTGFMAFTRRLASSSNTPPTRAAGHPWVKYTDAKGKATEYSTEAWTAENQPKFEKRVMDCLDCHAALPPVPGSSRALDVALSVKRVDPLPWVNKKGLEILQADYASTEKPRRKSRLCWSTL
jgi:hypothetical protein